MKKKTTTKLPDIEALDTVLREYRELERLEEMYEEAYEEALVEEHNRRTGGSFSIGQVDDAALQLISEESGWSFWEVQSHFIDAVSAKVVRVEACFDGLADALHSAGAFDSQEEAHEIIDTAPWSWLEEIGVDGLVPSDGWVANDEEAGAILALAEKKIFRFHYPLAAKPEAAAELTTSVARPDQAFTLVSEFTELELAREFDLDKPEEDWLWIQGSHPGHRHRAVQKEIEAIVHQAMGALLVLELASFGPTGRKNSPPMAMARPSQVSSSGSENSRCLSTARQLLVPKRPRAGKAQLRNTTDDKTRLFEKLFNTASDAAESIRHACLMFLRAEDAWGNGEAAMFLVTTLEGLLLDKKNKDDLSSRLQEAVAYLLASGSHERDGLRLLVKQLYAVRSQFVHNGETAAPDLDKEAVSDLVRQVIHREIVGLS